MGPQTPRLAVSRGSTRPQHLGHTHMHGEHSPLLSPWTGAFPPSPPRVWGAWASTHRHAVADEDTGAHCHTQALCVQEGAWLRHTCGLP